MILSLAQITRVGYNECLTCWHCIAENCDLDPESNFRAEKRQCNEGHLCQKVYFEMQSDIDDARYKSTVRSCAEQCEPRDDYQNCTRDLYITRGCVHRVCCQDDDLCNSAPSGTFTTSRWAVVFVGVGVSLCVAAALKQSGDIKGGPDRKIVGHKSFPAIHTHLSSRGLGVSNESMRFRHPTRHVQTKDKILFDSPALPMRQFSYKFKKLALVSASPYGSDFFHTSSSK